ncbi:unnamed protein product [Mytilus coruscus]|uniref:WxxW domain-containing protein n=1 Tax=Mytilus coruscus TaxID=42192 RepID=A0A6J8DW38_MYTCO|nr:unnamed protein product [Mytilus coruscus]
MEGKEYVVYNFVISICTIIVQGNTTPTAVGYWTQWYDVDTPRVGIGDVETVSAIEREGLSICDKQYFIYHSECRTHIFDNWLEFTERDAHLAPDKLHNACTKTGLECRNEDQPMEATCRDYQVRFYCALPIGKDIIKEDNSSMIALAAGLTFLFPIVVALIINVCNRYCRKKPANRLPIVARSRSRDSIVNQALFDAPPSYNLLFSHNSTVVSTENLIQSETRTSHEESISNDHQPNQICIHTLPSSNSLPINSESVSEADSCYRQFRDRIKKLPGMHLSVMDMYNQYRDSSSTTPPPSYNEALVILATLPGKQEES